MLVTDDMTTTEIDAEQLAKNEVVGVRIPEQCQRWDHEPKQNDDVARWRLNPAVASVCGAHSAPCSTQT